MEIIFEVRDAEEGGYYARALGHAIFTEAETWDELRVNVLEATFLHFEDEHAQPRLVQLHYVKDELIPVELPRGAGQSAIRLLEHLGYVAVRQKGSDVRLRHPGLPVHSITSPKHNPMKTGTFHSLIVEVALMRIGAGRFTHRIALAPPARLTPAAAPAKPPAQSAPKSAPQSAP